MKKLGICLMVLGLAHGACVVDDAEEFEIDDRAAEEHDHSIQDEVLGHPKCHGSEPTDDCNADNANEYTCTNADNDQGHCRWACRCVGDSCQWVPQSPQYCANGCTNGGRRECAAEI